MINPVDSFILNAARLELKDVHIVALNALATEISDWNEFENKTRIHGVQALIYNSLKKNQLSGLIPQPVYENLRASYYRNAYRNALFFQEIEKLETILDDKIVLLKGASLIHTVYNNIALRELSDIDILVSKENAWGHWNKLRENGYHLVDGTLIFKSALHAKLYSNFFDSHLLALRSDNVSVDVHWNLMRAEEHYNITAMAYEQAVCINEKNKLYVLKLEFQLIFLCTHFAKHLNSTKDNYAPIKWLCDINALFEKQSELMDWGMIKEISKEVDIYNEVKDTLTYAHILLGLDIPKYFYNDYLIESNDKSLESLERKMTFDYQINIGDIKKENLMKFSSLANWKEKFVYFLRSVLPVKKWITHKYGSNVVLGYPRYWSDMFARYILKKK